MNWCEAENNRIYYLLGLTKSNLLNGIINREMAVAKSLHAYEEREEPARSLH